MRGRLYLDLDGVLYHFEGFYADLFGHRHDSVPDNEMWENIHSYQNFFIDMPLMKGALDFYEYLESSWYDIHFLTACPKSNYEEAAKQKRMAVRRDFSRYRPVIPMLHGKYKHLFMHAPGDILIDDFAKNVNPWIKSGGFGIIHKDFETTHRILEAHEQEKLELMAGVVTPSII